MEADRVERRLAAILAADVAGYSRLMGVDEEGTLASLTAHRRELFDPHASTRSGSSRRRVMGLLAEFASVVDAVRCAVEVQAVWRAQCRSVPAQRLEFRIGINLGDVVEQDGDIFGDGVNIAARLEGICEPGGVCMSEDAYRQVRDKIKIEFGSMTSGSIPSRISRDQCAPIRWYRAQAHRRQYPRNL